MSITTAISKLALFSDQENVPKLISDLTTLASSEHVEDEDIKALGKELQPFLSKKDVKKDGISLADAAYDTLLALATLKPPQPLRVADDSVDGLLSNLRFFLHTALASAPAESATSTGPTPRLG